MEIWLRSSFVGGRMQLAEATRRATKAKDSFEPFLFIIIIIISILSDSYRASR